MADVRENIISCYDLRLPPLAKRTRKEAINALRFLLGDIEAHAEAEEKRYDYLRKKVRASRWHIAAALGFDIDNGHEAEQHRSWSRGDLSTLSDLLDERFPEHG